MIDVATVESVRLKTPHALFLHRPAHKKGAHWRVTDAAANAV
jgi:hypothetical protein